MQSNAENISNAISSAASSKVGAGTALVAGGLVVNAKDPQSLGQLLATTGPELFGYESLLSWSEWMAAAGALLVTYKLIEITISLSKDLIAAVKIFAQFCRGFKRKPIKIKPKGSPHGTNSKP